MPTLIFDRKVPLSEQRLKVALSKVVRHQGKKHGTGKRSAAIKNAARKHRKHCQAQAQQRRAEWLATARTYWAGLTDMSGQKL